MVKPAIFHPAARETIRSFPVEVRKELGKAVYDLQRGEAPSMPLSRPMTSIAPGAAEFENAGSIRNLSGFLLREVGARCSGVSCFCEKGSRDTIAGIKHRKKAIEGVAL